LEKVVKVGEVVKVGVVTPFNLYNLYNPIT